VKSGFKGWMWERRPAAILKSMPGYIAAGRRSHSAIKRLMPGSPLGDQRDIP